MKRKLLNVLLIIAMALSLTMTAFASTPESSDVKQSKGVYITIMMADPVFAYEGGVQGMPATKPGKGGKINPNSAHVKKYNSYLKASHTAALREVGASPNSKVYDYVYSFNGFAAWLSVEEAAEMAKQPDVVMVIPDSFRFKETESAPDFLGLTDPAGPWAKGYDGEGVVVGIIDTGIWPEHPSFANDGSYAPPPVTIDECHFGNTAHNPDDAPFTCNNKLIGARQMLATYRTLIGADPDEYDSARDDDGHGSHTASTAAG